MTEDQLSALLRTVKRYEQPPPGYSERLLRDLHRRQRTDLLRLPLWKIALERLHTLFGEHSMGPVSYGAAMAGLVVLGLTAIGVMTPSKPEQHGDLAAAQTVVREPATPPAQIAIALSNTPAALPASATAPGAINGHAPRRYDAGYVPAYSSPAAYHFQE